MSAGESFGSSVHNTLKKWGDREVSNNQQPIQNGQISLFTEEVPEKQPLTLEALIELWHQSFIVQGYDSRHDADTARQRGEHILKQYYEYWQQQASEPVAVERGFTITIGNHALSGRFDRVERTQHGIHVIDFKTGKPRPQAEVDADLQLSIYALAVQEVFGEPCAGLSLLFLRETGIEEQSTIRSSEQLTVAAEYIASLSDAISLGDFTPTPGAEVCGRCPYKNICSASLASKN